MKLLVQWLISASALLLVAYLYSGVQVDSFGSALIAAFVIGLFNAVLRPVLVILTLPVTIVTVGLFLFVINALMFWSAAGVLGGFHVSGFGAALLGSLLYSLIGVVIDSALGRLFAKQRLHGAQARVDDRRLDKVFGGVALACQLLPRCEPVDSGGVVVTRGVRFGLGASRPQQLALRLPHTG